MVYNSSRHDLPLNSLILFSEELDALSPDIFYFILFYLILFYLFDHDFITTRNIGHQK
jgi:hypothetical protein